MDEPNLVKASEATYKILNRLMKETILELEKEILTQAIQMETLKAKVVELEESNSTLIELRGHNEILHEKTAQLMIAIGKAQDLLKAERDENAMLKLDSKKLKMLTEYLWEITAVEVFRSSELRRLKEGESFVVSLRHYGDPGTVALWKTDKDKYQILGELRDLMVKIGEYDR